MSKGSGFVSTSQEEQRENSGPVHICQPVSRFLLSLVDPDYQGEIAEHRFAEECPVCGEQRISIKRVRDNHQRKENGMETETAVESGAVTESKVAEQNGTCLRCNPALTPFRKLRSGGIAQFC